MKPSIGYLFFAGTLVLGSCAALAADPFMISSPAFKDSTPLQKKYAGSNPPDAKPNPNCVGENVSPPLSWANPPSGTRSYALTMVDPEGRLGQGVVHWLAYGIPVAVTGFAEGEVNKPSPKYVGGKGTNGFTDYRGPCTPRGMPHHYTFVLIATDLDPAELPPGLTRDELLAKVNGHAKGATGTVGLFGSP